MIRMTSTAATEAARCLRCHRPIRSAEALATGYGAGCLRKIRTAVKTADLDTWTPRQIEDARELIEDGGVVPTARPGVFRTVSSDGSAVYLTSARFCGCPAGLKDKACFHRCAVVIVLASQAPPVPAAVTLSAPAIAPASIWDEIERLNDAFMAMA